MINTPVVSFNFNRPQQTARVLDQLERMYCKKVYLVCDGPRPADAQNLECVLQVQDLLRSWQGAAEIELVIADSNLGIRDRFYSALDAVFRDEPSAIILEDDCVVHDSFFSFAEQALSEYSHIQDFGIVSAHNPMPISWDSRVKFDTYPRIWGWATSKVLWTNFRSSEQPDYSNSEFRRKALGNLGSRTMRLMFSQMMNEEFASQTWDVDFASYCISRGLTHAMPPTNLCSNLGLDGRGTHAQDWSSVELPPVKKFVTPLDFRGVQKPSWSENFQADFRRLIRWSSAGLRNPVSALRKFKAVASTSR